MPEGFFSSQAKEHDMSPGTQTDRSHGATGHLSAAAAFLSWGLLPVYWKTLGHVPAFEIMCHRMAWSAVFTALVLTVWGRWGELKVGLRDRRTFVMLCVSSVLIGANWLTYIWSVNAERVLETSLGYYIVPMVNALLGWVVLKDRPRRLQFAAILLAAAGVANLILFHGGLPWPAMVLAFSFGLYGLTRKMVKVGPVPGLFFETFVLTLPALAYLLWLNQAGQGSFGTAGAETTALLAGAGPVTTMPLIFFALGAKRLRLVTLGFYQYIAPTCFFLLGVFAYNEPFTWAHLFTFACIWAGIALYSWEGVVYSRRAARAAGAGKEK
jgi:chloramphenicol-sensitive protein RarD